MTENELIQELAALITLPEFDPAVEVTAGQVAKYSNKSVDKIRMDLNDMVKKGELKSRLVRMPTGQRARAYRKL